MGAPTRFGPAGVTNVSKDDPLKMMGQLDPTKFCTFFTDFHHYTAADWTVTETQVGATQALADGDGGLLLLTNTAADNDLIAIQKIGEGFLLAAGKQAWFKARFKVSDATQTDFLIGLQVTDTTPFDAADGIYFQKDDGDAQLDIFVRKDATTGSNSSTNIATVVSDTFMEVAWYYDGVSEVKAYVDGTHVASLTATSTYLPDTELTLSFALQNGEAVAKTMTVDYLMAVKER